MSLQLNQGFCCVAEKDLEQETVLEMGGDHWKRWGGERSRWRNEAEEEGEQDWELKEGRQVGGSREELGLETNVTTTDFIKHIFFFL